MIKKHKVPIIISCFFMLLPIISGLLLWNQLPDQIPTHFASDNTPDQYMSKAFVVFAVPVILLLLHLLCLYMSGTDTKKQIFYAKYFSLLIWAVPMITLFMYISTYSVALGYDINIALAASILIGVIFIIIGCYMPRFVPNTSIGIKTVWTVKSEKNWIMTHRFASILWIIGGIVFIINGFLKIDAIMLGAIALMALMPIGYSFVLHKKGI